MYRESFEQPQPDPSGPSPSPALRERVLGRCRRAMEARLAARRRQRQWQWRLAAGAAVLLLFNAIEEHQTNARIAALVAGGAREVVAQSSPAGAIGSLRTRRILLAALLRDPNSL